MTPMPQVVICAGGGGVGKTTTSAALGLYWAQLGARVLVVTVDPARRLAAALGIEVGGDIQRVSLPGVNAAGTLDVLMPRPEDAMEAFADALFSEHPERRATFKSNRIYASLAASLGGIQEFVAVVSVAQAAEAGYDVIVIDTAPSRHALDFLRYASRLAELLEGRAVGWFADLASRVRTGEPAGRGGIFAWGKRRVEAMLSSVLDVTTIEDLAGLFGDLASVRTGVVALARQAETLLLGPFSRFVLVGAPTEAAYDDVLHLQRALVGLGKEPDLLILNRAESGTPAWLAALGEETLSPSEHALLETLSAESDVRTALGASFAQRFSHKLGAIPLLRLPYFERGSPLEVVLDLAEALSATPADSPLAGWHKGLAINAERTSPTK